ncbi:flagellar hook-length control protein FliK [Paenibacillus glufosinatiresistens]|uniref:flagellar hook-length control protein FliK n=1 Tax=Paenibacillus glufosinatiresistens TaxID=3070657 RepID=UPI00286E45F1|nr:flagellar hook-length control protein FliK [Paenibacillus sp. YX.27]
MSLVFNMVSAGKSSGIARAAGAAAGSEVQGALLPFSQTLVQTLAGTAQTSAAEADTGASASLIQASPLLALLAGQASAEAGQKVSDGAGLIAKLEPELDQLDEQLNADPALLATLQQWLVQAFVALKGSGEEQTEADTTSDLPQVAQNAGTVRFALQDALNRLVAVMEQTEGTDGQTQKAQVLTVLNQFSEVLNEAAAGSGKSQGAAMAQSATPTASLQDGTNETGRNSAAEQAPRLVMPASDNARHAAVMNPAGHASLAQTSGTENDSPKLAEAAVLSVKAEASGDKDSAKSEHASVGGEENRVVTAGQLSLRDGLNPSVKNETPQVPVQRFAQEMNAYIGGKMEVIKRGDALEATLSLFPEHLGQVDVKITMQNGLLVAHFATEHAGAKDLLENQMAQLRSALQSQGLQVEKLEVTQNTSTMQSQMYQDGRRSGSGQQGDQKRSKSRSDSQDDAVAAAELEDDWRELMNAVRNPFDSLRSNFIAEA